MARTMSTVEDATEIFRGVLTGRRWARPFDPETRTFAERTLVDYRAVFGPYTTPGAAKRTASGQAWGVVEPRVTAERAVISEWRPVP